MDDDGTTWTTVQGKNKGKAKNTTRPTPPAPLQTPPSSVPTAPSTPKDLKPTNRRQYPPSTPFTNKSQPSHSQTTVHSIPHQPHKYHSNNNTNTSSNNSNNNSNFHNTNRSNKFRKRFNPNENPRFNNNSNNESFPNNRYGPNSNVSESRVGQSAPWTGHKRNNYHRQYDTPKSEDQSNANTSSQWNNDGQYSSNSSYQKPNKNEKKWTIQSTNYVVEDEEKEAIGTDATSPTHSLQESNEINSNIDDARLTPEVPAVQKEVATASSNIDIKNDIDTCTPTPDLKTAINIDRICSSTNDDDAIRIEKNKTENNAVQLKTDLVSNNDNSKNHDCTTTRVNSPPLENDTPIETVQKPPVPSNNRRLFDVTSIVKDAPQSVKSSAVPASKHRNKTLPVELSSQSGNSREEHESTPQPPQKERKTKDKKDGFSSDLVSQFDIASVSDSKLIEPSTQDYKIYDNDFLMSLQHASPSHGDIAKLLRVDADDIFLVRITKGRKDGEESDDHSKDFNRNRYSGRSSSHKGSLSKRNSQAGGSRTGGSNSIARFGGNSGDGRNGSNDNLDRAAVKVSISLRGDIKLNQVENAWKPSRLNDGDKTNVNEYDKETAQLYKKVRSILNKLTPENFDKLLKQFRDLRIGSQDRLNGVINLVFDKATDEPGFSQFYAKMCQELHTSFVDPNITNEERMNGFRSLLIRRCQIEFEKSTIDETTRNSKVKEIEECTDTDKRKELEFDLEEYDAKLRRKSLGTIRFIGELFKQKVITAGIVVKCLKKLLNNKDEESLECLCKLIATAGPELEDAKSKATLETILTELKAIANNSNSNNKNKKAKNRNDGGSATNTMKVSSRIRFMIMDIIDLKNRNWASRQPDSTPKTMDQILKDINNEQQLQSLENASLNTNSSGGGGGSKNNSLYKSLSARKDLPPSKGSNNYRQQRNSDKSAWNVVGSSNSASKKQFKVETDKFRVEIPTNDSLLGSSDHFVSKWCKGAGGGGSSANTSSSTSSSFAKSGTPFAFNLNNSFSVLENFDNSDRQPQGWNKMRNSSKSRDYTNPSKNRNSNNFDRLSTRSSSAYGNNQSQNRFYLISSSSNIESTVNASTAEKTPMSNPTPQMTSQSLPEPFVESKTTPPEQSTTPPPLQVKTIEQEEDTLETSERLIKIDEYSGNLADYFDDIKQKFDSSSSPPWKFVYECLSSVVEKSQPTRLKFGEVLSTFLKTGVIALTDFSRGLNKYRDEIEEIRIDVPQIWKFLGEILATSIQERAYPLESLHTYLTEKHEPCEGSDDFMEISPPPSTRDIQLILKTIFSLIVKEKGNDYMRKLWQESGLNLLQFGLSENELSIFIAENRLEYLEGSGDTAIRTTKPSSNDMSHNDKHLENLENIHSKLREFLRRKTPIEDIISWISTNVGDGNTTNKKFLRVLATAIYEDSISIDNQLIVDRLVDNSRLLQKYVDYKVEYELECLIALHALSQKLEHPKGLLLEFCNTLYDNTIISKDAFIDWEGDSTLIEGRGVVLYQLISFFTQLRENEDDDDLLINDENADSV